MFFRNKLLILLVILIIGMYASSNQVLSYNRSNYSSNQSITKNNTVSENVTIIIYNFETFYSDYQIQQINNYVNTVIKQEYPNTNLTVVNNTADPSFNFSHILESILTLNQPNYAIMIGGVGNYQSSYLQQIEEWMAGSKYTYIKEFGLINYMQSINEFFNGNFGLNKYISNKDNIIHNVTLANIDFSQAGFISGVQASFLTKSDKIGIILDHSMNVNFDNSLNSPEDSSGTPYYSFDRANFVTGFIAGVQYASEVYLKGLKINIKSTGISINDFTSNAMDNNVQSLANFGADVIFNMETNLDSSFIQKAKTLNIQTGVFGPSNYSPNFSFNENTQFIIQDFLNQWNTTSKTVNWTYNLANSTVLSLSSMKDSRLATVKTLILNGTILIHNYDYYLTESKIQDIPGFEMIVVPLSIIAITLKKKLRK